MSLAAEATKEAPGGLPFLRRPVARHTAAATRLTPDDEQAAFG